MRLIMTLYLTKHFLSIFLRNSLLRLYLKRIYARKWSNKLVTVVLKLLGPAERDKEAVVNDLARSGTTGLG